MHIYAHLIRLTLIYINKCAFLKVTVKKNACKSVCLSVCLSYILGGVATGMPLTIGKVTHIFTIMTIYMYIDGMAIPLPTTVLRYYYRY